MAKNVYIACTPHGVTGAASQTTFKDIEKCIRTARKKFGVEGSRKMHAVLAKNLSNMLPQIMKVGFAYDEFGERYDADAFDSDLVWLAVYDHVGNGKKIAIMYTPVVANAN